jgi:ribonuclease J
MSPSDTVTITPLGGMGEIGMNCLAISTEESMIVVDCGLMFPEEYHLGIDIVIPRFDFLLANRDRIKGIVLTHGHEDHIGALPWLLRQLQVPLYGSGFTLGLVGNKLREHELDKQTELHTVVAGDRVEFGDIAVQFFPVCHSIIEGFGLGIETPAGRIVHSGDFKIDPNPLDGHFTDLEAFREFSDPGVLLLLSDSTNIEREGDSLKEREIVASLDNAFSKAEGRIIVTLFSSHIQRIHEVFDLAVRYGRKVSVSGRSLVNNIELAKSMGFLNIPDNVYCSPDEIRTQPDENVVLLVTGSQGEPLSALTRIATGEHRQLSIHPGDTVLMSSRFIPGNIRAITRVINRLYKQGAEVLYGKAEDIHASGHGHREELRLMLETVRPKHFVPLHGEYRHLAKHCRLAKECGVAPERAIVLEDGNPLTFSSSGVRFEEPVPAEGVNVDGKGVGDVGQTVLKERHLLGGEGLVVVVLIMDENTGEVLIGPDIHSKGFVFEQHFSHVLEDAREIVLDICANIPATETGKLKERIRSSLRRHFRKTLGRDPVVLALVMTL